MGDGGSGFRTRSSNLNTSGGVLLWTPPAPRNSRNSTPLNRSQQINSSNDGVLVLWNISSRTSTTLTVQRNHIHFQKTEETPFSFCKNENFDSCFCVNLPLVFGDLSLDPRSPYLWGSFQFKLQMGRAGRGGQFISCGDFKEQITESQVFWGCGRSWG